MIIRDATPADYEAIRKIHADGGLDYALPALDSPLLFVNKVAVDDSGNILGCCFLRLTSETYLLLEPQLSAKQKLEAMLTLQPAVLSEAYSKGIDETEARIPETIESRFRKRLKQLGWVKNRSGWFPWTRSTHA